MSQQIIGVGAAPGDGTGDAARTAFIKVNANFSELYTQYNQTAAEISAGVTPVNYGYAPGDVLRYGADKTGVADSTQAILNAVSVAALGGAGGGGVYLPSGTYLVNSSTLLAHHSGGVYIYGDGVGATQVVNASSSQPAFNIGNGVAIYKGSIRDLSITGKSGVVGVNGQSGINLNTVNQFQIQNVQVNAGGSALYRGVTATNCGQCDFVNLFVTACLNDGITLTGTTDAYTFYCISQGNSGSGFTLNAAQGGAHVSCYAYSNGSVGWYLVSGSPSSAPNKNNGFIDCVGDTSANHNWQIGDSIDSWWVGCWGSTQQSAAVNTNACGFLVVGLYCKGLRFTGCIAVNNNANGFQCYDAGSAAPTNITFSDCAAGSATNGGNGRGGSGYGFTTNSSCAHIRWSDGIFDSNVSGAVLLNGTDILLVGNPVGYITRAQGSTGAISTGTTVSHGLGATPAFVAVTQVASASPISYSVSAIGSSTFTINFTGGGNQQFQWHALAPNCP